jgi:hypothetical protein
MRTLANVRPAQERQGESDGHAARDHGQQSREPDLSPLFRLTGEGYGLDQEPKLRRFGPRQNPGNGRLDDGAFRGMQPSRECDLSEFRVLEEVSG